MSLRTKIERLPVPDRRAGRWSEHLLASLGLLMIIYHVGFELSGMVSPSMSPTLQGTSKHNVDWILTERISCWFRDPRRWEVVRFDMAEGTRVMKRVVALPGENVTLHNHDLMINGMHVAQPESNTIPTAISANAVRWPARLVTSFWVTPQSCDFGTEADPPFPQQAMARVEHGAEICGSTM